MEQRNSADLARLLLRKAAQDEAVVRKFLGDPEVADEVVAFHAQQAAEKVLKAVLAFKGIRYGKVHDLTHLIDLLSDHGSPVPPHLVDICLLTPFAVEYRYEDWDGDEESFDRQWAVSLIADLHRWAEAVIGSG